MAGKTSLFLCLLISVCVSSTFAEFAPWRSKVRVSPPRPTTSRPAGSGGNDQCGERYLNLKGKEHGVLTSPGYPNNYAAGLDCEWIIEGQPGSNVYATFFDIRTQNTILSDVSDSLYVSLGGNWNDSQRFSGDLNSVTPLVLVSDGNKLFLRFKSSAFSTGNRGFRAAFYSSTGKPALTEIGHDTYTVISCTYVPVDHPQVFPDEGISLKVNRVNPNPFLVGLILDERQFCSGSLVSDRHVVTSAHCTKGAKRIDMIFGTADLLVDDAGVQKRTVNASSVTEHPHFDTFTGGNDISVIRLNEPVVVNEFVVPAGLPTWAFIGTTLSGLKADITGWGDAKSDGNIYSKAGSRIARISTNAACRTSNRGSTGHSMCSQGNSTQGSCQTDSGSPIVTRGNICGGQVNQGGQNNANAASNSQHAQRPTKPNKPGNKPGKPNRPHFRSAAEPVAQRTPVALLLGVVSHGSCEKGFSATRITAYLDFLTETVGPLE